ncbi:MAG: hypothetical protein K9M56_04075 [Victivallales bacterium]|nr:hypothetical protein [Victivallales bacterium]
MNNNEYMKLRRWKMNEFLKLPPELQHEILKDFNKIKSSNLTIEEIKKEKLKANTVTTDFIEYLLYCYG